MRGLEITQLSNIIKLYKIYTTEHANILHNRLTTRYLAQH